MSEFSGLREQTGRGRAPWETQTRADLQVIPAATVTAIIPAHNEEQTIARTLECLRHQERRPDRVIVVADNCTDATALIARGCGAEVFVTKDNQHMKAGALNQLLRPLLPVLRDTDLVAVIDADTTVSSNFLLAARDYLLRYPEAGGVSGVYGGHPGGGLPGWGQRNEFARWGFDSRQQNGKAICLSGAASVFRVSALRLVTTMRATGDLPGVPGDIYSTNNFTEDFELSQAVLHAGFKIRNLPAVHITTAVKPTWRELHVQRLRWNRGITETLLQYGLTRHTVPMWLRWANYTLSVLALPAATVMFAYRLVEGWQLNAWMYLWIAVTGVVMLHKSVTLLGTRRGSALAAAFLVFEMPYDTFLHATFVRSLWHVVTGQGKKWR